MRACERIPYEKISNLDGSLNYYCPACHKLFQILYKLFVHFPVHTGEILYTCIPCQDSFSDIESAQEHIRWHENILKKNALLSLASTTSIPSSPDFDQSPIDRTLGNNSHKRKQLSHVSKNSSHPKHSNTYPLQLDPLTSVTPSHRHLVSSSRQDQESESPYDEHTISSLNSHEHRPYTLSSLPLSTPTSPLSYTNKRQKVNEHPVENPRNIIINLAEDSFSTTDEELEEEETNDLEPSIENSISSESLKMKRAIIQTYCKESLPLVRTEISHWQATKDLGFIDNSDTPLTDFLKNIGHCVCGELFKTYPLFKEHIHNKHADKSLKMYYCNMRIGDDACPMKFKEYFSFLLHLNFHGDGIAYSCLRIRGHNSSKLSTLEKLRTHLRAKHQISAKTFSALEEKELKAASAGK